MLAATAMVVLLTAMAAFLGPFWSGLLSPFPVFAGIMAAATHKQSSPAAAQRLLRGVLAGSFGFAAFFIVLELFLGWAEPLIVYMAATVAALCVNGLALLVTRRMEATADKAWRSRMSREDAS